MAIQKGTISVVNIGVDGNDNFLGVYPTLLDLQNDYPTAEAGNFAFVDEVGADVIQYVWDNTESQWIAGATVGGVISVNGNAGPVVVLDADDIGDSGTTNKFVTAGDLQKLGFITIASPLNLNTMASDISQNATDIGQNASDITNLQNNKISKPNPVGSFQYDILSRGATAGEFNYLVPKNGVVKLNNAVANTLVTDLTKFKIVNQVGSTFFPATEFPKNISNNYPGQDPVNNYATFIPHLYNSVADKWLENPINSQVTLWRIGVKYTRVGTSANRELIFSLENPVTGFVEQECLILPAGAEFQTFEKNFLVATIADADSIGEGYEMFLTPNGENITLDSVDVTRISLEKI